RKCQWPDVGMNGVVGNGSDYRTAEIPQERQVGGKEDKYENQDAVVQVEINPQCRREHRESLQAKQDRRKPYETRHRPLSISQSRRVSDAFTVELSAASTPQ